MKNRGSSRWACKQVSRASRGIWVEDKQKSGANGAKRAWKQLCAPRPAFGMDTWASPQMSSGLSICKGFLGREGGVPNV